MNRRRSRYLRRTDLFLVRMWADMEVAATRDARDARDAGDVRDARDARVDTKGPEDPPTTGAGAPGEWSGNVQRVVDGEARRFTGWQSLVETLAAMLAESRDMPERQEVTGNENNGGTTNE